MKLKRSDIAQLVQSVNQEMQKATGRQPERIYVSFDVVALSSCNLCKNGDAEMLGFPLYIDESLPGVAAYARDE